MKHDKRDDMPPAKRVLITGINGFVGSHLAEACAARGWRVFGTIRSFRSDLKTLSQNEKTMELLSCDLLDYSSVADAVRVARPDCVFHLAAQSFVPASWNAPRATMDTNVIGTLHVLEAVRRERHNAVVQVCGSSEEYGYVEPSECPIKETNTLRPLSPYGVSKVAADVLTRQYAASYGLHAVVTRAFNHTGPRRGHAFAESQWARDIALFEAGFLRGALKHGNLDAVRDYTDVRDTVQGYILAVERGQSGAVYNFGWGDEQSPTMREVLRMLLSLARVPIATTADPKLLRPSDVPRLVADATKARAELDWKPEIPLRQTLQDLLNYWRREVSADTVMFPERKKIDEKQAVIQDSI